MHSVDPSMFQFKNMFRNPPSSIPLTPNYKQSPPSTPLHPLTCHFSPNQEQRPHRWVGRRMRENIWGKGVKGGETPRLVPPLALSWSSAKRCTINMASVVLKSLSILLGIFFIFVGVTKLTPNVSKELYKELVSNVKLR